MSAYQRPDPNVRPADIQPEAVGRDKGDASYLVRSISIASQAFSASANVLKGDPPILMAGLLISMGRQEATKPGRPCSPGPLLLSLLTTNEKPHSLALHISNSSVAAPTRLKCRAISRRALNGPRDPTPGPPTCRGLLPARVLGASAGSEDSTPCYGPEFQRL